MYSKIILLILVTIVIGCNKEEKVPSVKIIPFAKCESLKICKNYEKNLDECENERSGFTCNQFLEDFKKLALVKKCSYPNSDTPHPISSVHLCDSGRNYPEQKFIHACILIEDLMLENKNAQDLFISKVFRAVLDGESAEAFKNKSFALEDYYNSKVRTPKELYVFKNIQLLEKISKEQLLEKEHWVLVNEYLTVKMPKVGEIEARAIPNYDLVAKVIITEKDKFLLKQYMNFLLGTQGSADEMRSFGFARIYDSIPHRFLDVLSTYRVDARSILIKSLTWGIMNIKGDISKRSSDEKLKANFPSDRSVYNKDYQHDILVRKILSEVKRFLQL